MVYNRARKKEEKGSEMGPNLIIFLGIYDIPSHVKTKTKSKYRMEE